ncbi:aminotransferase class IV [Aquiflexum gelatinilyticum]|uniref:aminotransferase class IV n=1 Tax=Aquiflexum gelatinilyticum TaxID=2961943 RepID=UPI002167401B|nr:aminotransferase class IV [Aquiflexum gelatinilyticum]MCS4435992.1 aminotransferase class IV [Aquiflexum gelatinilyticum]
MKQFCFSNDRIIDSKNASIHPMDIGLIRGYGIFDFFRTSGYTPLFLTDYLDRFIRSAKKTHLHLSFSKEELAQVIHDLIQKNDLEQGGIRMLLTGGVSDNHFSPTAGSLFIFCEDLDFPAPYKYENGVKLLSADHVRAIADVKTTNYAFPVWHSADWKKAGAEDVIYHHNGYISESSRSNIFVIKDDKIATPDQNILHGITRKRILELDRNIEIRPISFDELIDADEVFMTATTKKILPVTMIDDLKIKDGKPGPKTIELMAAFSAMEKKSALV